MKFNKLMLPLLPLMVLTACEGRNEESKTDEKIVTINGYNSVSDMYRSKLVYPFSSYNIQCRFDINSDAAYIKEGDGSLKMYMNSISGGEYSYFVQRFSESEIKDRNISDIDKFSLWLYNDNEKEAKATLALIGQGDIAITSIDVSLKAGEWNYCEYDLSRLILENGYENVLGFGILLNKTAGTYYLDDWKVYFGAQYTPEDLAILDKVNGVSDQVASLNFDMDFSNESENAALEAICASYYAIDSAYRGAVKGSDKLVKLAKNYCDYLTLNSGGTTAFNFSKSVGVSQASVSVLSAGVSLSYSQDFKRANEGGALKISSNGSSKWIYLNFVTSANVANYSKFGLWFYNDSDLEYGFCIQWNAQAQYIKPSNTISSDDGWQYIEYSCSGLSGKVEFEYCAVALDVPGGVLDTYGDLYISDVVLIA